MTHRDAAFYDAGWVNALATLETVECDILVTITKPDYQRHFPKRFEPLYHTEQYSNRHERVLFIGAINGLTPANLTGAKLAAVEDLGILEGIPDNDITSTLARKHPRHC